MRRGLRTGLLIIALTGAIFWAYVPTIKDEFVIPKLREILAQSLGREATFDSLEFGFSSARLRGLRLGAEGASFRLGVDAIEISFLPWQLGSRKISSMSVSGAKAKFLLETSSAEPPAPWKEIKLPFSVDQLQLQASAIDFYSGDRIFGIEIEDASGAFGVEAKLAGLVSLTMDAQPVGSGEAQVGFKFATGQLNWTGDVQNKNLEAMAGALMVSGLKADVSGALDFGQVEADSLVLEVKAKADEFLFGDWYGELADFPLSFSLHRGNAAMKIEATAGTGIKAEIDSAGTDLYRAKIELLNLAQISNKLVPETSRASFPQTGKVSLELAMNFEQGIAAAGKAKLIGVSLTDKETQVNLDGAIPFEWISADSKDKFLPKSDRNGELKVSAKVGKEIELKETKIKLVAGHNTLGSDSLIDLQFFGGVLSLKSPNVDCSGGLCRVSADLDLQQLDLARLGAEMKLPVGFEGKADANLGRVQWSAGSVTTSGTARIAAFNGEITASNILVQNPSNSFRTISGDVALQGIDLKRVSGAFGFGEMEGILDGSIRGLELFGSTPAAFEAEFATRDKGARSISATAINNLAVVSQGQGLSALSSGVYSLFTWYHYRKFGLKCRLKNDVFELYGTARAGSDNYIIDGGWLPPKVDLVTMNPRISFTEMVSRIARVSSQDPEFN